MGSNSLENRNKVYDLLLKGNKTSTELARLLNCDRQVVSNHLRRLKEYGMVKIVGNPNSTPLWAAEKNPKPRVKSTFQSKSVDTKRFRESIKGTPWQGMEHLL